MVKTLKRWTNETEWVLQACLDLTDWSVFEAAANYLDDLTETVTSYIGFCEYMCIPTRTHLTYNSDKPRFTAKLRQLRQAKENAYRKGDIVLYKQAKYTLEKEIRVAKRNYSNKLRTQFYSSDSASVWKGLKAITNYKTPSPSTVDNQQQAIWMSSIADLKKLHENPPCSPHTYHHEQHYDCRGVIQASWVTLSSTLLFHLQNYRTCVVPSAGVHTPESKSWSSNYRGCKSEICVLGI